MEPREYLPYCAVYSPYDDGPPVDSIAPATQSFVINSICMLTHAGTCASLLSHQGFETWNLGERNSIACEQLKRQCFFSYSASCERHTEQYQPEATFPIGGQIVRIEPIIERNNGSSPSQWKQGFTELWSCPSKMSCAHRLHFFACAWPSRQSTPAQLFS